MGTVTTGFDATDERQSIWKSKTKNGRLVSLTSNLLVTVPILKL